MGLGFCLGAELPVKGLLRKRMPAEKLLSEVGKCAFRNTSDPIMRRIFSYNQKGRKSFLVVHPTAEPVQFIVDANGFLTVSANTSTVGPGYHKYLIELLEKIGSECSLIWRTTGKEKLGDETGYINERNYASLQYEMLKWLQAVARILISKPEEEYVFSINLPLDEAITGQHFASTWLGPLDRKWFEEVAETEIQNLHEKGREFFPWWDQEMDALFWKNCGLSYAWFYLPWNVPIRLKERELYQLALDCFKKAKELDPTVHLPEQEMEEIQILLSKKTPDSIPPKHGLIGYRRALMNKFVSGGWRIEIPGYYYEDVENNGTTTLFWFGERTVRVSSITVKPQIGKRGTPQHLLSEILEKRFKGGLEEFEYSKGHLLYRAYLSPTEEKDGKGFVLRGAAAMTNSICIVTILFTDSADKEWAVRTWKSIYHP
jgi:hypothetical protein